MISRTIIAFACAALANAAAPAWAEMWKCSITFPPVSSPEAAVLNGPWRLVTQGGDLRWEWAGDVRFREAGNQKYRIVQDDAVGLVAIWYFASAANDPHGPSLASAIFMLDKRTGTYTHSSVRTPLRPGERPTPEAGVCVRE